MTNFLQVNFDSYPISIVQICGGLGNQMFHYAFFLGLQSNSTKGKFYINIDTYDYFYAHNGFVLDRVFGIPRKNIITKEAQDKIIQNSSLDINYITEKESIIWQKMDENTNNISIYLGYWQSEKYFRHIAHLVKKYYRFDEYKLNNMSKKILRHIKRKNNTISIHFRRCDYFINDYNKYRYGSICTKEYYQLSINKIKKMLGSSLNFYLFSDDTKWVEDNFDLPGAILVDCNSSKDSWQDMCLMSTCQHHIVANSTFSWWGAWLGNNCNSIVIAPEPWFNREGPSDILPNNWFKIKTKIE